MRYDAYIKSLNPIELQNFKDTVKLKYQDEQAVINLTAFLVCGID